MEEKNIIIDTNIFIDHLRNFEPATIFFESLSGRENVFFSAITEAELLAEKHNNILEKREKLIHFLFRWNKIPVDNPLVMLAGDISRTYEIAVPDAIIAATAMLNNAKLLTKNTKDFKKISSLIVEQPY